MLRHLTAVFALLLALSGAPAVSASEARSIDASVVVWISGRPIEQILPEEARLPASRLLSANLCEYRSRITSWSARFALFQRPPPHHK